MIFKGAVFFFFLKCHFLWKLFFKIEKQEGGLASSISGIPWFFPKLLLYVQISKQMCNLTARCITYFTMLVELLLIKNIKAVCGTLILRMFFVGCAMKNICEEIRRTSVLLYRHVGPKAAVSYLLSTAQWLCCWWDKDKKAARLIWFAELGSRSTNMLMCF